MSKVKKTRGITLVELIVAVALASIMGLGLAMIINPVIRLNNEDKLNSDYQATMRLIKNILMDKLQFSQYVGIYDSDSPDIPGGYRLIFTKDGYLYENKTGVDELVLPESFYSQLLYSLKFSKSPIAGNTLYVKIRAYKRNGETFKEELFSIKILNLLGEPYYEIDVAGEEKEDNWVAYKTDD